MDKLESGTIRIKQILNTELPSTSSTDSCNASPTLDTVHVVFHVETLLECGDLTPMPFSIGDLDRSLEF